MSVETGDDADLGAPVWASFGDLMSVLLGAFVLVLVGVIAVQAQLAQRLDEETRRILEAFAVARDPDPPHHRHVAVLALALFDQLRDLHGLEERCRPLLEAAALLHDVGWCDGGKGHLLCKRCLHWRHLFPGDGRQDFPFLPSVA